MPHIRSGRHPHEVAMLVAALALGSAGAVAFDAVATTTARALTVPWGHVLYAGVALGAAITLTGITFHGVLFALLERAGLMALAGFLLVYAAAVIANSGVRGVAFAVFVGAFSVANLARAAQIGREIREHRAAETLLRPHKEA